MLLNILYTHHTSIDENFIPDFIELYDVEDVHLELGDEVDAREGAVLPVHAVEDDGATTLDEPSTNLIVSQTPVLRSEKVLRAPIMWLVALMSTTHLEVFTASPSSLI
jgi:hypothetical protein